MNFHGKALPLADRDVATVAGYLGCHIAAVRTVLAVEAAGKGFDAEKRPKILFERHKFYKYVPEAKRATAIKAGLVNQKAGGYGKAADQYPKLERAMAIDAHAALLSCSWGVGQVMGFNHKLAGFDTVEAMVEAMKLSEGAQLFAVARFIVSTGLAKALRSRDWPAFAKGYNGEDYKRNEYDAKLADAYAKRPAAEKVTPPPASEADIATLLGHQPAAAPAAKPVEAQKPVAAPQSPATSPRRMNMLAAFFAAGALAIGAAWNWLLELPCNLIGVLCQ